MLCHVSSPLNATYQWTKVWVLWHEPCINAYLALLVTSLLDIMAEDAAALSPVLEEAARLFFQSSTSTVNITNVYSNDDIPDTGEPGPRRHPPGAAPPRPPAPGSPSAARPGSGRSHRIRSAWETPVCRYTVLLQVRAPRGTGPASFHGEMTLTPGYLTSGSRSASWRPPTRRWVTRCTTAGPPGPTTSARATAPTWWVCRDHTWTWTGDRDWLTIYHHMTRQSGDKWQHLTRHQYCDKTEDCLQKKKNVRIP